MIRKSILGLALLSVVTFGGCAEEETTNTMEGVDQSALDEYDQMIAEDEQMMDEEDDSAINE